MSPALVQASSPGASGARGAWSQGLESRGCTNRPPGPGVSPQGRSGRGWGGGAGLALGEFQACESLGLWPWTGMTRRGGRACCPPGPRHEGLALSPDAPQNTPQTIPSYLAKALFFFFFSKFEDSVNRRKRILWKEEEDEPRAGSCFRRWRRVVFTSRGRERRPPYPWRGRLASGSASSPTTTRPVETS